MDQWAFARRALRLMAQPLFISLAVMGNTIILSGACAFYFLERGDRPTLSFLDALWWAVATVTTVGYGDISPTSISGKCVGIVMMLLGATLFCSFTGLFAAALVSGQIREVEVDVRHIEEDLRDKKSQ